MLILTKYCINYLGKKKYIWLRQIGKAAVVRFFEDDEKGINKPEIGTIVSKKITARKNFYFIPNY